MGDINKLPNDMSLKNICLPYEVIVRDGYWEEVRQNRHFLKVACGRPLILSGAGPTSVLARRVSAGLGLIDSSRVELSGNGLNESPGLQRALNNSTPGYLIAVGGGSIVDYAKVLATDLGVPLILAPTTLSNDAMCSPVARAPGESHSRQVNSPALIILDVGLIASGPTRLLISGIGDLLANATACVDWEISNSALKEDDYNHLACTLALNAAYGFFAQTAGLCVEVDKKEVTMQLARAHILSGLAMSIAGSSRPCSGAEHSISHALDELYPGRATHGEQVAVSTHFIYRAQRQFLEATNLCQGPAVEESLKILDLVKKYFDTFPLPRHPEDIGFSKNEFRQAVLKAPTIRDRTTILNALTKSPQPFELFEHL